MPKHDVLYQKGGIKVIYSDFYNQDSRQEKSSKNESSRIWVFTYCLQGETAYLDKREKEVVFNQGHKVACIHQDCEGMRITPSQKYISQLRLSISEKELVEYVNPSSVHNLVNHIYTVKELYKTSLSANSLNTLRSLLWHIQYQDYIQAHINTLSLLQENLVDLNLANNTSSVHKINQRDLELANKAKKIMDDDCTLHIHEIAQELHITEQKIRTVFNHYHGISPKQYLIKNKMEKAKILLKSGLSTAEIAYLLGYEFPNNFTLAFKKYYGISPTSYKTY